MNEWYDNFILILSRLEHKDIFTLSVGLSALFVSIATLSYNIISKKVESVRSAQADFASAIDDLIEVRKEREDLILKAGNEWASRKYANIRSAISDRREVLISRIISIRSRYKFKITDVQSLIIGAAYLESGQPNEAARQLRFSLAVDAHTPQQGWVIRSYGVALIRSGRVAEGREQVRRAAALFDELADHYDFDETKMNYMVIETFLRIIWAQLYANQPEHIADDYRSLKESARRRLTTQDRTSILEAISEIDHELERLGLPLDLSSQSENIVEL